MDKRKHDIPKWKQFSRKQIQEDQQQTLEDMEKQRKELRLCIEEVSKTTSGNKFLKYLFLLCGGDTDSLRRNSEGRIDIEDTINVLGARGVWEKVRFNMSSERIRDIERHNWEGQDEAS